LIGTIIQLLVQKPQFCLPMADIVDLLRYREPGSGDTERRARAAVGWGVRAGLFFHDTASDTVHLGLSDL